MTVLCPAFQGKHTNMKRAQSFKTIQNHSRGKKTLFAKNCKRIIADEIKGKIIRC